MSGRASISARPPARPPAFTAASQKWVYLSLLLDWAQTYSFIISPMYPWDTFNWSNSVWHFFSAYVLQVGDSRPPGLGCRKISFRAHHVHPQQREAMAR